MELDTFLKILIENDIHDFDFILDVGSGSGQESKLFSLFFPNKRIFSFECNPDCITEFKKFVPENVTLIEKAVWESDGYIDFFPIRNGNTHASSAFLVTDEYNKNEHGHGYLLQQEKILVESVTLQSFIEEYNLQNKNGIIWIDLQGAELKALKGMGKYLKNIKAIWTEGQYKQIYKGVDLFEQIEFFLFENQFNLVFPDRYTISKDKETGSWWSDFCFLNK
jgi:FkbM family methyltransferase